MRALGVAALAVLLPSFAGADLVVDQQQPDLDPAGGTLAVGGDSGQKLAQTVMAGMTGPMTQVELPIGCASGTLIVDIVALDADGRPGARVLGSESIPAADLPSGSGVASIDVDPPVDVREGRRFAIVLRNPTGACGLASPPGRDTYARGRSYFDARPNPPGWIERGGDLPFKTLVDRPPAPPPGEPACAISGPLLIHQSTPVCRCLVDPVLRAQRCALLDPSFFLFRSIPWPLRPGQKFRVEWTLVPLTRIAAPLEVSDRLPAGFQAPHHSGRVFAAAGMAVGKSTTLVYDAVAGKDTGPLDLETTITAGDQRGSLRSVIEVAPR